jgi:hypothetical protein
MPDGVVVATASGHAVRLQFQGAKPSKPLGVHLQAAKSNYLIGSDPARWHTGVPNYREVRYAQVYPGIDIVWHAQGQNVEHDFVLAPRADRATGD